MDKINEKKIRLRLSLVLLAALLIWGALSGGISFYVDALWFKSLGYWQVFKITLIGKAWAFLAGFLVSILFLSISSALAIRRPQGNFWFRSDFTEYAHKGINQFLKLGLILIGLFAGGFLQARWMIFFQYINQVPTGNADPIFGKDISFYLFSLPVLEAVSTFGIALAVLALLLTGFLYVLNGHLGYNGRVQLTSAARIHLTILLSLVFLTLTFRFWVLRFEILYNTSGAVFGAGYTDLYAWLPCYWLLAGLSLITAILIVASLLFSTLKPAAVTGIIFGVVYLGLNIYPSLIQTFIVEPNELQKESPYIDNNIQATLKAYKLDSIETNEFIPNDSLNMEALDENRGTLKNIRLWDWRPLKNTYEQLQSIRLYYEFENPDVDRYVIDGEYRQVLFSARELEFSRIAETAQNWINRHFVYTHGQGICMSPVNEVTSEGLPEFFIQDIPPRSNVDLQITRPEIYFGEKTEHPVFVKTNQEEFDYPMGDQNATTIYEGDRGLPIDSFFMRLVFSWELKIYQILFTDNFTENSRILLHRRLNERIPRIAPFLSFDRDPYLVIHDGRLLWIQDAYTVSDRYPYSEPFPERRPGAINYIRNSVKIVMDAYLGDVTFYVADEEDPLIKVYEKIFPEMFKPLDTMDPEMRKHIRYPLDLFDIQREVFGRYHMTNSTVFYNQEDVWEIPTEIYMGNEQQMESYYIIMSLPGSKEQDFLLLTPFTPKKKNNMISWMAALSDGSNYGRLVLYQFPKQALTYGPMQVEARIDQNPDISQLITLWGQKGSRVIRGNLLVIPIENSILYVEPLYLQAEKSEIPELTRVIIVYNNQVTLGETLEDALHKALSGSLESSAANADDSAVSGNTSLAALPQDVLKLVEEALNHYLSSQKYIQEGNWTAYGAEQKKLGEKLAELKKAKADGIKR